MQATKNWSEFRPGEIIKHFTQEPPVDVVSLAEALGLRVWEKSLPNISGMVTPDQLNGGRSGYSIYVNAEDPLNRRRFTIAHEIAHYLLHRKRMPEFKDDRMYRSPGLSDDVEAEANRLAADILMPRRIIRKLLDQGVDDPRIMASRLMVSPDAMEIRLGLRSRFNTKAPRRF